jgi:hypothetical protein
MNEVIRKEEIAKDYAEYKVQYAKEIGIKKMTDDEVYQAAYKEIMAYDDFKFIEMFYFRSGQKLMVVSKNRYLLSYL